MSVQHAFFASLFFSALTLTPVCPSAAFAESPKQEAAVAAAAKTAQTEAEKAYAAAIEESYAMQAGPEFFVRVRDLYTKLPIFNAYGEDFKKKFAAFADRLDTNDQTLAADVKAYSAQHLALPEVHSRAAHIYEKIGDTKSAEYEMWLLKGLLGALMKSGDGTGPKTAYQVITPSEEYLIARNRITEISQSLQNVDGHVFDVLTGKSKKTGETISIWFNIDEIWAAPY